MSEPSRSPIRVMSGNEACAHGALAAGLRFFAGYPITPSSEIAEELAVRLPKLGGVFMQMEDEIAAMGAVVGASLAGAKAMTATSGPGFSLKQENIGFACMTEVPCVIVDVQRGGPSTGLPTMPSQGDVMQARWGTHGDHPMIALAPFSVAETFELTVRAFNLAERYRTPVVLLYDEVIGHVRERVTLPDPTTLALVERPRPTAAPDAWLPYASDGHEVPAMADFGSGYRWHVTGLAHDERGYPTQDPAVVARLHARLGAKLERHRADIVAWEGVALDDAEVVVVAFGVSARAARRAVTLARRRGARVGLFRPRTLWPFPAREVADLAGRARALVVAEMNLGQIVGEVERAVAGRAAVTGRFRADGQPMTPQDVLEALAATGVGGLA